MSPPLRRGWALGRQRMTGLAFLAVLFGLVSLAVAQYQKAFTPVVMVTVEADRIGNQLTRGADVKARGMLVGEVRAVTSNGAGATISLALNRDAVSALPSDLRAQMIPKTLFGEKIVDLVLDDASTARPLRDGDVISQDRSTTARETAEALDHLLPLLQTLKPVQLSTTLNALSATLRGRGTALGENLVLVDDYLRKINPELPTLRADFAGLADFGDTVTRSTTDLAALLDNSSFLGRSLVDQEQALTNFLTSTTTAAGELDDLLTNNETRLIRLAADSLPSLQVYQRYAPGFACLLKGLQQQSLEGEKVFGGLQPGLHITLEVVRDQGGYRPGEEPVYGEDAGPTCVGLPPNAPIVPFPVNVEVTDGYCDEQERQPGVQNGCDGRGPDGGSGSARRDAERAAIGAIIGPLLGVAPHAVPDLALLLFGPLARGTEVSLR